MVQNIYLIRHGESQGNQLNIKQGLVDYDLSDLGIAQSKKIKLGIEIDKIYSSPYKRAYYTAEIISANHNLKVSSIVQDDRLREWELFNEKSDYQLSNENRIGINPYVLRYPADYKYGNGESFLDIQDRLYSFLQEHILADQTSKNIVIVSHAGAINHILYLLIHGKDNDSDKHYDFIIKFSHIKNAGITKLVSNNGVFVIDYFNNVCL